jgi:hypothetical protein
MSALHPTFASGSGACPGAVIAAGRPKEAGNRRDWAHTAERSIGAALHRLVVTTAAIARTCKFLFIAILLRFEVSTNLQYS